MIELTDLEKKVHELCKSHPDFSEERFSVDIQNLHSREVVQDLFVIHQRGIRGKKGNSINSWIAFYLGITNKKPEQTFVLEKRRTYGRAGFPDIDMDFDWQRRYEIIEYLIEKYGRDRVGNIGTIQTLKTKAAVRHVIKVLDPTNTVHYSGEGKRDKTGERDENFALENTILKTIVRSKDDDGNLADNIKKFMEINPDFQRYMGKYPAIYKFASSVEGTISAYGCHAAGVVLSPIPLEQICPLHITQDIISTDPSDESGEKTIATQFTMSDVESLGLIKFDILGLSTKTAITWAVNSIKDNHDKEIDLAHLPLTDSSTLELLKSGETNGCFQLENNGMQKTLREIGIDSFNDLVIAVAMYRPGPLQYISQYARSKRNPKSVSYIHPIVKKHTEKTFGIIGYQEQAMNIFVELAGLTPSEGYIFIKGAAKKKPELFQSMKDRFIEGATRIANRKVAEAVWKQMEPFQGYAFNKSHAVSYAYESWKTAYLKAHYPTEFFEARLSVENIRRNFDDVTKYEGDAVRNWDFTIDPPDINKSGLRYTILGPKHLRRPLLVKGVGVKAVQEIVKHQPFNKSDLLYNFYKAMDKCEKNPVTSKVLESMWDAGLWRDEFKTKEKLILAFEKVKKDCKRSKTQYEDDAFE